MSFEIKGGYKFSVSIGKFEDFLTDDKFISFILIENIGLSLPYWELKFDCVFPDLLKYLNEQQPIQIQIGTGTSDLVSYDFVIKKPIVTPKSSDCSSVILRGFTKMHSYLETEHIEVYPDYTTSKLVGAISGVYGLTYKTNMGDTKDKMTYYQPGICDFKFLYTEWLHSYYQDDDIIIPTITADNVLTYNSLSRLIARVDPEKIPTFTDTKPETDYEIQVNANTGLESNTTLSNMLGNYMKQRDIFYVATGKMEHIDISNKTPIISESKTTSVDESISKSSGLYYQSENVHERYYKQELLNTQKWFGIQSSKQWVQVKDMINTKVKPGELVMYMSKKSNGQINDSVSGLYLVAKKVLSVKDRTVSTNFQISRENMNYSK